MKRLLKFLLTGDWHLCRWKVIEERNLTIAGNGNETICRTKRIVLQCEHCGEIKYSIP